MEVFTTNSSGIQYGLVKDHGKCDLEKAKSRIANPPMRDHPYAVHVFRNVIELHTEMREWTMADVGPFMEDTLELSLQSVKDYRLYEKCKESIGEQGNGKQLTGKRREFVVQNAGDLLYVRYGILHQVVNVGVNVAEAINVGSDGWNFSNEIKMLCPCEKCQLVHAATNTDVDMLVKVGKSKTRTHICDVCDKIFGTKTLLVQHQKDDHSTYPSHVCRICHKAFKHSQSLNKHVRIIHSTGKEDRIRTLFCDVCKKGVEDIVRHKRERHQQLVECSKCKTNYTRYDLVAHEKICMKFPCSDCSKEFKSRQSLANHRARWCNKQTRPMISKKRKVKE